MSRLKLVHSDPTGNPPLTDEQLYLAATALTSIQGGGQSTRRGNSATRLLAVKNFLFAAMARGDVRVDIDELLRVAEGDVIPDLVA